MRETTELNAGTWWRFDRYQLRNGMIRPARGAQLTPYNPWDEYKAERGQKRDYGAHPPYDSLLELVQGIETKDGKQERWHDLQSSRKGRERLQDWCARYGLLGVLLQRVQQVTLPPRWEYRRPPPKLDDQERQQMRHALESVLGAERVKEPARDPPPPRLVPALQQYFRTGGTWSARLTEELRFAPEGKRAGQLVTHAGQCLPAHWPRPGVLIQDRDWRFENLGDTWARFFPSVRANEKETYRYPAPLSAEFWEIYAEPIADFIDAALDLRRAIEGTSQMQSLPQSTNEEAWKIRGGWHRLRRFYDAGGLLLVPAKAYELRLMWVAPTLLASLAIMAAQDMAQNRLKSCAICHALFLGDRRALYCTDTCKRTANTREKRRHRRERGEPCE